jgi:proline iminopeptidase
MAGLNVHSAHEIRPEWQRLQSGDSIHISAVTPLKVERLEPDRALVLHTVMSPFSAEPVTRDGPNPGAFIDWTWAFVLQDLTPLTTRLMVRVRADYQPDALALLVPTVLEPVHFVMEYGMLQGLKRRAEGGKVGAVDKKTVLPETKQPTSTMRIRDASLYVKVMGQGYPILLMHGGPGLDHTSLLPLQPLADQFTLIFYDHRCNGRSEGAAVETMTWENLTADAEALRETLGFKQWAVLGHSFGGNVALEYALRYPQSLSRLILMDTTGDACWARENAPRLLARRGYSAAAVQAARRFFSGQVTPREWVPTFMKFMSAYSYRNFLVDIAHVALSPGPSPKMRPEPAIFGFGHLLADWTVMHRLGEIRVPTLVLAGRYDFLFPPEHEAILADRIANAQLEIIERAGHNPQMERTTEVVEVIQRFMLSTTCASS